MIIATAEPNRNREEKQYLPDLAILQIELGEKLAEITMQCPTCRKPSKQAIQDYITKKTNMVGSSSQEESQTKTLNPNNNAAAENQGEVNSYEFTHRRK